MDGVTSSSSANPAKAQVLESLLQELSFWEPMHSDNGVLRKSRSVNDVHRVEEVNRRTGLIHATSYGGSSNATPQSLEQEQPRKEDVSVDEDIPAPPSPTLAELQASCFWNKAIDPSTGRTYYYDIRTRQTQWEKVRPFLFWKRTLLVFLKLKISNIPHPCWFSL